MHTTEYILNQLNQRELTNGAVGVSIYGTMNDDVIDATQTVAGQPLPSQSGDIIFGYDGKDKLSGLSGDDQIHGGSGRDLLVGGRGADSLWGDAGKDVVSYSSARAGVGLTFSDLDGNGVGGYFANATAGGFEGEAKGDSFNSIEVVVGSRFSDAIGGGTTKMQFFLGAGDDGFDTSYLVIAADEVHGQSGADHIWSGPGADLLYGDSGDDVIFAEEGDDFISGGKGIDQLWGGEGKDVFVLSKQASSFDLIEDFEAGIDSLQVSAKLFGGGLRPGMDLKANQFEANDTGIATDGDVRFILNSSTGELFFDPDGSGAHASQVVAIFGGTVPTLGVDDFMIT